ncbi:S41 family peptidase [Luteolibacter pohnpeiensis]|uniref:S41 family peptidase n=1 Tax=Luteolibacter pohnpeiensis TaxID=454153 RepID=A0A934VQE5_9BACT|nr:S41 family peptidase [Luteolibacter pohnpeiensis]MBK1882021.1 S41 family peptidase [Luteolibacter pohnpeiensis]
MRLLCLFAAMCLIARGESTGLPDPDEAAYPAIERFVQVLETVRARHPDVDKLAYDRLVNHALEGMLASLDPHSSFIHPEMARMTDLDTEVPSIGLSLGLRDDGPYIAAVAPLGPAAQAKVLPGSSLLSIDGQPTKGAEFGDLLASLHRQAGEVTHLKIKPVNEPRPVEVALTHRYIEQQSVTEAKILNDEKHLGYVRLARFGATSAREMEAALDELEDKGMTSLILDLRGNGGGDLHETVKILGLLLPPNTAVVTTRGRDGEMGEPMKTPERQRRKREYPVTVMIDRMSASASELTAGALQDLKRATIVGEVSYGKGSVQNIIPMGGGTALRLTIATYHTPSGRTPHGVGITPDIPVEITTEDRENFENWCRLDSLPPEVRTRITAWHDKTLEKAIETAEK